MTTTTLDERLDRLDEQVAFLVEQARRDMIRQSAVAELLADLAPVSRQFMSTAGERLEELDLDPAEAMALVKTLGGSLGEINRVLAAVKPLVELSETVSELSGPALEALTRRLADLDERGYLRFAGAGVGVLDRVVTGFDESDVEALGENVVLILRTLRDMTQPEIMQMLQRTIRSVKVEDEPAEPPGMFELLRQLRKPEARRGLARMIHVLDSLGNESAHDTQEVTH
jgi:uncharacterized protein YjgD (DUF1641 family)